MDFTKLKNKIVNAYIDYGYARSAMELSRFSTSQLAEIGISKQLLSQGASAYPWRLESASQEVSNENANITPSNVTMINTATYTTVTQAMPIIPKAA